MISFIAIIILSGTFISDAQMYYQQQQQFAHPSVLENSYKESELAPYLLKSQKFYSNPKIAAILAKESWFTDQESAVVDREAEKIPRTMVFKIFKNAGWINRR